MSAVLFDVNFEYVFKIKLKQRGGKLEYTKVIESEIRKYSNYNLNTYPYEYLGTLQNLEIYDFNETALADVVAKAEEKYQEYKKTTLYERTEILLNTARMLEEKREMMAEIISYEAKKPIKFALQEVDRSIQTLKLSGIEASKLEGEYINLDVAANGGGRNAFTKYESLGVVYAMTPFNFPLNLVIHKAGPALAVGNSIIVKPSEKTPFSTYFLKYLFEQAGLPDGVLQVVTGDGERISDVLLSYDEIKKLSFTGSVRVGKILKNKIGLRKLTLELGSTSALYISKNIKEEKLDNIAAQVVNGAFSYNGQACISTQKVFIDDEVYDTLLEKIVKRTKSLNYGSLQDEKTDYSDLIDAHSQERILGWIKEAEQAGAKVLVGGEKHEGAVTPTVLTNTSDEMKVCSQEIFGPVVVVENVKGRNVLKLLNDSKFGLNIGVFSSDLEEALQLSNELDYGQVLINDVPTLRFDHMPYNGRRNSGYGTEGIKYAIKEMSQLKMVSLKYV